MISFVKLVWGKIYSKGLYVAVCGILIFALGQRVEWIITDNNRKIRRLDDKAAELGVRKNTLKMEYDRLTTVEKVKVQADGKLSHYRGITEGDKIIFKEIPDAR